MPYSKGVKRRTNLNSPSILKSFNQNKINNYETSIKNVYDADIQNLSSERS